MQVKLIKLNEAQVGDYVIIDATRYIIRIDNTDFKYILYKGKALLLSELRKKVNNFEIWRIKM